MSSAQQQQKSSSTMSSPPSPLVWFLLLDSATGEPYKGTTVSSVLRSSLVIPVVDQFRDAVQLKYDKPDYLKDIPSGALLVYKNKAAFDKRNAPADEGKEEPLEEDSLVDGLGRSKKEALIVVVPSPTSSPELDQVEQDIKALENSEKYKSLASKNRAWAIPKPTEQEEGEWQLLKEKLADLKRKEDCYQKAQVDPTQKPAISITRHQDYKHSKAVHSSRSYLTTIAVELEKLYVLEKAKPDEPATFGDILWNSRRIPQPAPKLPNLPELGRYFTKQEWTFLKDLNNTVNPALHSELDVGIDGKTREVVLPIQLSHFAATCKRIAKKAKVVNEVSDLIVKNEGSASGGSPDADEKLYRN